MHCTMLVYVIAWFVVIFGINTTRDISKLSQISLAFEISRVVFMPNITTNHAITYTNLQNHTKIACHWDSRKRKRQRRRQ